MLKDFPFFHRPRLRLSRHLIGLVILLPCSVQPAAGQLLLLPETDIGARRIPQPAPLPEDMVDEPLITAVEVGPQEKQESLTAPPTAQPVTFGTQDLIFGLQINNIPIEAFIYTRSIDDKLYIPLRGLSEALEFPITVETAQKKADGWFIREGNKLSLDEARVRVADTTAPIKPGDVAFQEDDIYIAQDLIADWFGFSFKVNTSDMVLAIQTERPLPFEEKLLRARRMKLLEGQSAEDSGTTRHIGLTYLMSDYPYVDVNLLSNFDTRSKKNLTMPYNILSRGDLLEHTTELFIAGDPTDSVISDMRMKIEREDENKDLLGPLGASSYSLGDVNGNSLPLVSSSAQGRGITLSNRSLYRPDQFDSTDFRGTATPGWDVELYRNDTLLNVSAVGDNSQYEFLNVPLFFGRNVFRIVLYGPQGQIEEVVREFFAGDTLLQAGEFTYNFSLSDNNKSLFGLSDSKNETSGLRAVGEMEYGIGRYLTAAAGAAQLQQEDGSHQYLSAGLRTSIWGMLASSDLAYDVADATSSGRLSLATRLLGVDVRAQQTFFNGMLSDENRDKDNLLDSVSDLDLNTDLYLLSKLPINLGAGVSRKLFEDGDEITVLRARIARQILGLSLSNTFEKGTGSTDYTKGTFSMRGAVARVMLGATLDYNIAPESEVQRFSLTSQFRPADGFQNRSALQVFADRSYNFSNTLSMDMKKYNLSLLSGASSEGDYFIGLGVNISFTRLPMSNKWHFQSQPMADSGGALMRAYLDKNNDYKRNEDEPFIPDINFRRDGTAVKYNDKKVGAYATDLADGMPTRISIERKDNDPMFTPAVDAYDFIPRAGRTAVLDFPIYEGAQLDGSVSRLISGQSLPTAKIKVELLSKDGEEISATLTEFDGYYLFENVRPGSYIVRTAAVAGEQNSASASREIALEPGQFYTIDLQMGAEAGPALAAE